MLQFAQIAKLDTVLLLIFYASIVRIWICFMMIVLSKQQTLERMCQNDCFVPIKDELSPPFHGGFHGDLRGRFEEPVVRDNILL